MIHELTYRIAENNNEQYSINNMYSRMVINIDRTNDKRVIITTEYEYCKVNKKEMAIDNMYINIHSIPKNSKASIKYTKKQFQADECVESLYT
jgi:hypothetical protein